jgi:hypothetical protein
LSSNWEASDTVEEVVGVEEMIGGELRWWRRSSWEADGGVEEVAGVKGLREWRRRRGGRSDDCGESGMRGGERILILGFQS